MNSFNPADDLLRARASYLQRYADEGERLAKLDDLFQRVGLGTTLEIGFNARLMERHAQYQAIISRKNFVGHITASAFVLNKDLDEILLIDHPSLKMKLQPGGHVEPEDKSLPSAAMREVLEETGVDSLDYLELYKSEKGDGVITPFDIDIHFIPSNPAKDEPEHWHHDFRFIFTTSATPKYGEWVALDTLIQLPTFERAGAKLNAALRPIQ